MCRTLRASLILLSGATLWASAAHAQFVTVHADLPLWTNDRAKMSPSYFTDGDGFGCASSVAFGDWRFLPAPSGDQAKDDSRELWLRASNYGVFHCYAMVRIADQREELDKATVEYSHFVEVGKDAKGRRLFVLQLGGRPGSDYILLAHAPGQGIIASFDVLPVDCPKQFIRSAGAIDILDTTYCAINAREDFLAFVHAMASKPSVGRLILVEREAGPKNPKGE